MASPPNDSQPPADLAALEVEVASFVSLPVEQQQAAFARLRESHPQWASLLVRWERAVRSLDRSRHSAEELREVLDAVATDTPASEMVPGRIGPYRVLDVLGEGGMGTVYLAAQQEPVRRRVALKVIKHGMDTRQVLARFELERQALALMDHDSIARVYEAGCTEDGRPYFVMEYVRGEPMTRWCDRNRQSLEQRIRLFQRLCAGVQHAHHKGVIHRDITARNVLVTDCEGDPVPKIIDFGLARAVDQQLVQRTIYTERGMLIGTPEYMSPEQADPGNADIDTRTDVYSLGVLLYELLSGGLPFPSSELRSAGMIEIQRRICEDVPPRPSARVETGVHDAEAVATRRGTSRSGLRRELRGDLDWIVFKAIDKDRNRRYATPGELAADLERYLRHEPVLAGPPSTAYRIRKFVERYRGRVVAAGLVLCSLVAGAVGTTVYAVEEARQREMATRLADQLGEQIDEFDMMSAVVKLRQLEEALQLRRPAWPESEPALAKWIAEAESLLSERPRLARVAASVRARRAGHTASPPGRGLDDRTLAFLQSTLEQLGPSLDALEQGPLVAQRIRLVWARRVRHLTVERFAERWARARAAIQTADGVGASRIYAAHRLDLKPQIGLIPIGKNPVTGLWEFYHLRSAWNPHDADPADPASLPIPSHADDGAIAVGEDTGIVFVLVPGGTVTMGAQKKDPSAPHHEPAAVTSEEPPHRVTLAPFFMARHELTIGQWRRLTDGTSRNGYGPPHNPKGNPAPVTLAHPTEYMSWLEYDECLARHGLVFPTEAQWEYAARAGSKHRWWTGPDPESLAGAENIYDQRAHEFAGWQSNPVGWNDRYVVHAPVGTFRPNPFGLYDVLGNVREWCLDRYDVNAYEESPAPGDGRRGGDEVPRRALRGGCFIDNPAGARVTRRGVNDDKNRHASTGARAARAIAR